MFNEYPRPTMGKPVSMTTIKNRLKKIAPHVEPHLSNVRINGHLHGCSGFLYDPETGAIVYLSTDLNHGTSSQALYRVADHLKDYTGGRNHFCDFDEITECAVELLENLPAHSN